MVNGPAMLIGVFGLQSELFNLTQRSIEALFNHAGHPMMVTSPKSVDDFDNARKSSSTKPQLLIGHTPSPELARHLLDSRTPYFLPLIDIAEACRTAQRLRKCDATQAVRHTSLSLAMLHNLALDDSACIVADDAATLPFNEFLAAIAHRLDLKSHESDLRAIAKKLAPNFDAERLPRLGDILPSQSDDTEDFKAAGELGRYALSGYSGLLNGEPATRFEWPLSVFMGSRPHGAYLNGPVSLVGGRRCFLFGPFIRIPAGRWRASMSFEVRDNISGNELKIDVYTDRVIWEGRSPLPTFGTFQCAIEFDVIDASLPLQIRLFNEEAAIEGEMDFHGVILEQLKGDAGSSIQGEHAPILKRIE